MTSPQRITAILREREQAVELTRLLAAWNRRKKQIQAHDGRVFEMLRDLRLGSEA